jgi:hypothetical protein
MQNITIRFEGLEEIREKIEETGSEKTLDRVNKKIIKEGQLIASEIASKQLPVSSDISKSGPKRAGKSRTMPMGHMFTEIPLSGITKKGTAIGGWVGWGPGDDSLNFYGKFYEEGVAQHEAYSNSKRPVPEIKGRKIFAKTAKQVQPMINELGLAEYEKILKEALE